MKLNYETDKANRPASEYVTNAGAGRGPLSDNAVTAAVTNRGLTGSIHGETS
jgi:hypothetical protein